MRILFTLFFGLLVLSSHAQSGILGQWKSMDENTGKPRSIIELTERNGKLYGKVIRIFSQPGEDPDPTCDKCAKDDPRYDKKVIGMEIITALVRNEDTYNGGDILDPETGKVYRCKIWREGENLRVRGYYGPFYRTQTWIKLP